MLDVVNEFIAAIKQNEEKSEDKNMVSKFDPIIKNGLMIRLEALGREYKVTTASDDKGDFLFIVFGEVSHVFSIENKRIWYEIQGTKVSHDYPSNFDSINSWIIGMIVPEEKKDIVEKKIKEDKEMSKKESRDPKVVGDDILVKIIDEMNKYKEVSKKPVDIQIKVPGRGIGLTIHVNKVEPPYYIRTAIAKEEVNVYFGKEKLYTNTFTNFEKYPDLYKDIRKAISKHADEYKQPEKKYTPVDTTPMYKKRIEGIFNKTFLQDNLNTRLAKFAHKVECVGYGSED